MKAISILVFLLTFIYSESVRLQTPLPPPPPPPTPPSPPSPPPPPSPPSPPPEVSSNEGSSDGTFDVNAPDKSIKFSDANIEDINNENFPDLIENFDFPNADIGSVISSISELTGKNFIIDPSISGKITIMAPTKITVAEAYQAFLSALAINGLAVVPSGKFLKIKPAKQAQADSEIYSGAYTPDMDQMITRVIQLKYIQAKDVNQFLKPLASREANFLAYEPTNTIIISDYGSNINRMIQIIERIDVESFNEQMSVIPIKFAKAKDISDMIEKIINKGSQGARGRLSRLRRAPPQNETKQALSLVTPDERTNSIIVVGSQGGIARVRKLISQLDFEIGLDESGGVHVYYVKYGEAKQIATTINGIKETRRTGGENRGRLRAPVGATDASTGMFDDDVKVTADEQTNSLVIAASKQDYDIILSLISKLDVPRDQVFVEAVIMEMEVTDGMSYGFSAGMFQPGTGGLGRAGFFSNIAEMLDVAGTTGLVLGFGRGEDVQINLPSQENPFTIKSLTGFLNFLKSVTNTNVLSTPQILALDNEEAMIEVGEEVPVAQRSSVVAGGIQNNSVEYKDATIKLTLTPYISPDKETIRLKIDQSIKQVSQKSVTAPALANVAVGISKRNMKSNVVVRNGDTVVLGGLLKDQDAPTISKVPLLGDIPILGWLFKSKQTNTQKLNLMVFLTPRIVSTKSEARDLSDLKLRERLQFIKDNMGGVDAHGRVVEQIRHSNRTDNVMLTDLVEEDDLSLEDTEDYDFDAATEEDDFGLDEVETSDPLDDATDFELDLDSGETEEPIDIDAGEVM